MFSSFIMNRVQVVAILGSIFLLLLVVELIRKQQLKEKYALVWLFICIFFIIVASMRTLIQFIADLLGIYYAPSAFLLLLIMGIFLILLQFTIILSKMKERIKILAQEVAMLNLVTKTNKKNE